MHMSRIRIPKALQTHMKTIEYWLAENTSWSGGISWFNDNRRYDSHAAALSAASNQKNSSQDESIQFRVTHVITSYEYTKI